MTEKYMTTQELCQRFRRGARTIARWPETRGFPKPALKSVGAQNLYLAEDVERWERENLGSHYDKLDKAG